MFVAEKVQLLLVISLTADVYSYNCWRYISVENSQLDNWFVLRYDIICMLNIKVPYMQLPWRWPVDGKLTFYINKPCTIDRYQYL